MEFICKTCSKSFKFRGNLSRHCRIHKALHTKCDCGLSFSRHDSLERHRLMSQSCRALEQAYDREILKSTDNENSSSTTKDAFTQTEKYEGSETGLDDNNMTDDNDDEGDNSNSSEIDEVCETAGKLKRIQPLKNSKGDDSMLSNIKKQKIITDDKLSKSIQSSENDDSDFSTPVINLRKKKHSMHRLRKILKLRKLKEKSMAIPSNPYKTNLFNQYGINPLNTFGSNIFRKLITTEKLALFKPRQHNTSSSDVSLFSHRTGIRV